MKLRHWNHYKVGSAVSRRKFLGVSVGVGGALYSFAAVSSTPSGGPSPLRVPPQTDEPLEMPTAAYRRRVANVQAELAKRQLDALVIASISGWPSGWDTRYLARQWPGIVAVLASGEPTLIVSDPIPPRPRLVDTWMEDVRWGRGWEGMLDKCVERLKESRLTRGKIAVGGDIGWAIKMKLADALPNVRFEEGNDVQDQVRLIKDEFEIRIMRRAAEIADREIHVAQSAVRPGRRIFEVIAETQRAALSMGADMTDSVDLTGYSSSDVRRLLSGTSQSHRISSGEAFLFEPIPFYNHYNVETPVTFALGKVSTDQKALADLCFEAFQACVATLKPGVSVHEAVKAANAVLSPKGYPENTNGAGHFIGIGNIERPAIERDPGVILRPGMTVSLHGNLSVPGKARAVVGCVFLINERGVEPLTKTKLEAMFRL